MSSLSKKKGDVEGYKIIAIVVVVFILLFALRGWQSSKEKPGSDDCMSIVTKNTVIVLDHSESVTEQTINEVIERALMHIDRNVDPHIERVSVFAINSLSKRKLVPLFSRCKPLAKKDANPIVTGTRSLDRKFAANFREPLKSHLVLTSDKTSDSPIAQAITDLSLSRYMSADRTSLLVFSDLMEHTNAFSLYQCADGDRAIGQYRDVRRGAQERPQFKNTFVSLNIIPRRLSGQYVTKCRDKFWLWFFGDSIGDSMIDISYLPGGL